MNTQQHISMVSIRHNNRENGVFYLAHLQVILGGTRQYPDAASSVRQLLKVLCDIENLASNKPVSIGESEQWAAIMSSETYCKALRGKPLYSALYGAYTMTLNDLNKVLKTSTLQEEGFKEEAQLRRSSQHCEESSITNVTYEGDNRELLRPTQDNEHAPGTESSAAEEPVPGKASRPPPIVLTPATNLIQLQKQIKGVAKQQFEFCSIRNGTRVTTKDYQSVKGHFEANNLFYHTFYPKSERPIKAVIQPLQRT
jgi:hypothetical protein